MSYREPAKRPLRLWYVSILYTATDGSMYFGNSWSWDLEADKAIAAVVEEFKARYGESRSCLTKVICGEDFAEREAAGPPKE